MKKTLMAIIKNPKVILVIILLLGALLVIKPSFDSEPGVAVRTVTKDSPAFDAGMQSPKPTDKPRLREVIQTINGERIKNLEHYYQVIDGLEIGDLVEIKTKSHFSYSSDKREISLLSHTQEYVLEIKPIIEIIELNETEEITVEEIVQVEKEINGTLQFVNETQNVTKQVSKTKENIIGKQEIGLSVYDAPTTNIRKGLDLDGGTRVLLQPEKQISKEDMGIILDNLKQRLNVYGLSDIVVRSAGDFASDTQYVVVEIAGANEQEVKDLIGRQGVFQAKIGNDTAFSGGDDIKNVCRTPDCS